MGTSQQQQQQQQQQLHTQAQPFPVDADALQNLVGMGFSRADAEGALRRCFGNVENAVTELLTGQHPPSSAITSQALVPVGPTTGDALPPLLPTTTSINVPSTASTTTTASADDPAMERAIRESIAEQRAREENELARAKQLGSAPMDVDASDDAVQKALLASLADAQRMAPGSDAAAAVAAAHPPPTQRRAGVPTGLRNTGNTCYFNSFVQTYFHIPALRRALFETDFAAVERRLRAPSQPPPPEQAEAAAEADPPADAEEKKKKQKKQQEEHALAVVDFMKELQRLFAALQNTSLSYVDPAPLLSALQKASGNGMRTDTQEDVGEVNMLFLNILEEGLKLAGPEAPSAQAVPPSLVEQLFQGEATEFITGEEEDGSGFEVPNKFQFRSLIVPVAREFPTLYDAVDSLMCGEVDYTSPKGRRTIAHKCSWITQLPPILMFQENRVHMNPSTHHTEKISLPLSFKPSFFADRFCIEKRATTTEIRKIVSELARQIAGLEHDRHSFTNFKGRGQSIIDSLGNVLEFCTDKLGGSPNAAAVASELTRLRDEAEAAVETLTADIAETQAQVDFAYEQQELQQREYVLYAAWIHGGSPSSGHYRSFIVDPGTKKWFEFNDAFVAEVSEDAVLKQGVGTPSNSISAYFLIYVLRSELERFSADLCSIRPPEALAREIDEANKAFASQAAALAQATAASSSNWTQRMQGEALSASLNVAADSTDALKQLEDPSLFKCAPDIAPTDGARQAEYLFKRCVNEVKVKVIVVNQFSTHDHRIEWPWVWLEAFGTREHHMLSRTLILERAFKTATKQTPEKAAMQKILQEDFEPDFASKWASLSPQRELFLHVSSELERAISGLAVEEAECNFASVARSLVAVFQKNLAIHPFLSASDSIKIACRLCLAGAASRALSFDPSETSKQWEQFEEVARQLMAILAPGDRFVQQVVSELRSKESLFPASHPQLERIAAILHIKREDLTTSVPIAPFANRPAKSVCTSLELAWTNAISAQKPAIVRFGMVLQDLRRIVDIQAVRSQTIAIKAASSA